MKLKIIIAAVMLTGFSLPLNAQDKIVISKSDKLPHAGVFVLAERILQEAYKRIGIQAVFKAYPVERALSSTNNGDSDANLQRTAGLEKQYPNLVMVPFPVTKADFVIFTKYKFFRVTGYNSLKPYSICMLIGSKPVELGTRGMQVVAVATPEQAFRMIDSGRVDVFVFPREGICTAKQLGLSAIKILEPPVEYNLAYHYVNKRHNSIVPRLAKALKDMEREGVTQQMKMENLKELQNQCY